MFNNFLNNNIYINNYISQLFPSFITIFALTVLKLNVHLPHYVNSKNITKKSVKCLFKFSLNCENNPTVCSNESILVNLFIEKLKITYVNFKLKYVDENPGSDILEETVFKMLKILA